MSQNKMESQAAVQTKFFLLNSLPVRQLRRPVPQRQQVPRAPDGPRDPDRNVQGHLHGHRLQRPPAGLQQGQPQGLPAVRGPQPHLRAPEQHLLLRHHAHLAPDLDDSDLPQDRLLGVHLQVLPRQEHDQHADLRRRPHRAQRRRDQAAHHHLQHYRNLGCVCENKLHPIQSCGCRHRGMSQFRWFIQLSRKIV